MASKIPGVAREVTPAAVGFEFETAVDERMVDVAVERVLRDVPEKDRGPLMQLWMEDQDLAVGKMLRQAEANRRAKAGYRNAGKTKVDVPHTLTPAQSAMIEQVYPEFELVYRSEIMHDHPMAALSRQLDTEDCIADVPRGQRYVDFGGNLMYHVKAGHDNCLVVGGEIDVHDSGREAQRTMELKKLAASSDVGSVTASMAKSILANEGRYRMRATLQSYAEPTVVGMMVHVYDVKLDDIAKMMDACGMQLFVGVVHFNPDMWSMDSGELPTIGAVYKIDRKRDLFSMGFRGSGAKWYNHEWSSYQRFGTDSIVTGTSRRFAYKIVKRRGDTIKFRLLPLDAAAGQVSPSVAVSPFVDQVLVHGYRLSDPSEGSSLTSRRALARQVKYYPKETWERMVRYASVEIAKGTLNYNGLVSSYRTMVASLKYNGIEVGTRQIPVDDVPEFIAMVTAYAASEYLLLRRSTAAFAAGELAVRALTEDNFIYTMVAAVATAAMGVATSPLYLLSRLFSWLTNATVDSLYKTVVVAECVEYVKVPAAALPDLRRLEDIGEVSYDYPFIEDAKAAAAENERAADQAGMVADAASIASATAVQSESVKPGNGSLVGDRDSCPEWLPFDLTHGDNAEEYEKCDGAHSPAARVQAILDARNAAFEEMRNVDAWMAEKYRECVVGGNPDSAALREHRETWYDPDLWFVEKGEIVDSLLTRKSATECGFEYMAVYCPQHRLVDKDGEEFYTGLYPVESRLSQWDDVNGSHQARHYTIDVDYTGFVMVCKNTMVYNGHEVMEALRISSEMPQAYVGGIREGGPGCGKTYTISNAVGRGDVVVSPLRNSVESLRVSVKEKKGWGVSYCEQVIRTVDSLLVSFGSHGVEWVRAKAGHPKRLWVDECFITLPGKLYAVAALLGVDVVVAMGDSRQIPASVRATYQLTYDKLVFEHKVTTWVVYRSCPEVLALFNHHYDNKLRTVNKDKGTVRRERSEKGLRLDGTIAYLCMNQADKSAVAKRVKGLPPGMQSSTHEAQGSDVDTVCLFDIDPRRRQDAYNLYNNPNYVNVAYSRAKRFVILVKPGGAENEASRWLARASDPRVVAACADMSSVGRSF